MLYFGHLAKQNFPSLSPEMGASSMVISLKSARASFAKRLADSRLVTDGQLASARAVAGDDDVKLGEYLVQRGLLTAFQLRQLRSGATTFFVGKYVVLDRLGRGGNSVVFKARHTLMPNRYA